jgi:hypothetical protein
MKKKFIGEYLKGISNTELLIAVADNINYREIGKRMLDRTVTDDIYELYTKPIGGAGVQSMIDAMNAINREVAERVVRGEIQ